MDLPRAFVPSARARRCAAVLLLASSSACSSASSGEDVGSLTNDFTIHPPPPPPPLAWQGWASPGGNLVSDPVLVSLSDYNRAVFAIGGDGAVWFTEYNTFAWRPWRSLGNGGNALKERPVAVVVPGSGVELFVRDPVSGHVLHQEGLGNAQLSWNAKGWEDLGGPLLSTAGPPSATLVPVFGRVSLFATFADHTPKTMVVSGYGAHGAWMSLGGSLDRTPQGISWGTTRVDVFAEQTLFVQHQKSPLLHRYSTNSGSTWLPADGWESLDGDVSVDAPPAIVSWGPNRLDVFATGGDQMIHHLAYTGSGWGTCSAPPCWETIPGSKVWDPATTDGELFAPAAISVSPNDLAVFWQGPDRALMSSREIFGNFVYWGWSAPQRVAASYRTGGTPAVARGLGTSIDVAVTASSTAGAANLLYDTTQGGLTLSGAGSATPLASACGGTNQPCCNYSTCGAWGACDANEVCRLCGTDGAPTCPQTPYCMSGLVVAGGDHCATTNDEVDCQAMNDQGIDSLGRYCCGNNTKPQFCYHNPNDPNTPTDYICVCSEASRTATDTLSYYPLAIVYGAPGNLSQVVYANGTTVGSHVQVQQGGMAGAVVQLGGPTFQANSSFMAGTFNGDSFQLTSGGAFGPQRNMTTDVIDHLQDQVWLWFNASFKANWKGNDLSATIGIEPGHSLDVESFTVGELLGVVAVPPYRQERFGQLSASDRSAILRADPFVVNGAIDATPQLPSARFANLGLHYVVRGPDHPNDGPALWAFNTNNAYTQGVIRGNQWKADASLMVGVKVSFITEGSALAGTTFEYNYQKTEEWDNGTIQTAQGSLGSSTTCWHQGVDVYWDSMFGTYLFLPTDAGTADCTLNPDAVVGRVTDAAGAPVAGRVVAASFPDGKRWETATGADGEYRFYDAPGGVAPVIARPHAGEHISVTHGTATIDER